METEKAFKVELLRNDKYQVSNGDTTIVADCYIIAEFICHLLNNDSDLRTVFSFPFDEEAADKWLAANDRVTERYKWY